MIDVNNFAVSSLRSGVGPSDTVLPLNPGTAARFNIPVGSYVYITLQDRLHAEVVKYTSTGPLMSDELLVSRGQDGTFARSFPAGTCVKITWNEAQFTEYVQQLIQQAMIAGPSTSCGVSVTTTDPTSAPTSGICWVVNRTTGRLWYYNSSVTPAVWVNVTDGVITGGTGGGNTFTIGSSVLTDNGATAGTGGCEMLQLSNNRGFAVNHVSDPACILYGLTTIIERPNGVNNDKLVVGHQLVAVSGSAQTAPTFGLAVESWVNSANPGAAAVGTESAVIVYGGTRTAAAVGHDVVFKNRPDTLFSGAVAGGLSNNQYNRNSRAVQISAQPRSTAGEFCGWQTGIKFFENALDENVDGKAVGIDFSSIAIAGQTTRLKAAIHMGDNMQIAWDNAASLRSGFNPSTGYYEFRNYADPTNSLRFGVHVGDGIIHLNGQVGSLQPLVNSGTFTATGSFMPIRINGTTYHLQLFS